MRYISAWFYGLARRASLVGSLDQPYGMCLTLMILSTLYGV